MTVKSGMTRAREKGTKSRVSGAAAPPKGERRLIAQVVKSAHQRVLVLLASERGCAIGARRIAKTTGEQQFAETLHGFSPPIEAVPEMIRALVDVVNAATAGGPQSPPAG